MFSENVAIETLTGFVAGCIPVILMDKEAPLYRRVTAMLIVIGLLATRTGELLRFVLAGMASTWLLHVDFYGVWDYTKAALTSFYQEFIAKKLMPQQAAATSAVEDSNNNTTAGSGKSVSNGGQEASS